MQLESVGEIVRTLRSRRGLEQVELARACGWRDASAVSRIETDRIKPTRRTLAKLASALATPGDDAEASRVRAWMFLASGIQPTTEDADQAADAWSAALSGPLPALVRDFAWTVWDANEQARGLAGLPTRFRGRNHIELLLTDPRPRGDAGTPTASLIGSTIRAFRTDTAERQEQRWYRRLRDQLERLPDFRSHWDQVEPADPADLEGWGAGLDGSLGSVSHRVRRDPRFIVVTFMPHDLGSLESMLQVAASG